MESIQAIYEGGVFRPVTPVTLPEHTVVEFEPRLVPKSASIPNQDAIYEILSRRVNSGDPYGAERHNEHQP
jgi:predicted DNA-binding antitoxin AbrB/MazE fold protein